MGGKEKKKEKTRQFTPTASDKRVRKKPSSNRPTATLVAEGEEARGPAREAVLRAPASPALRGSPPCAVWFRRTASTPWLRPSTSFPARGRGFISGHLPIRCPHVPPAAPPLQAPRQLGSPETHIQTHLLQNMARSADAEPRGCLGPGP